MNSPAMQCMSTDARVHTNVPQLRQWQRTRPDHVSAANPHRARARIRSLQRIRVPVMPPMCRGPLRNIAANRSHLCVRKPPAVQTWQKRFDPCPACQCVPAQKAQVCSTQVTPAQATECERRPRPVASCTMHGHV